MATKQPSMPKKAHAPQPLGSSSSEERLNALELWLSALQEIPRLLAAADTIDKAGKEILQLT